MRQSIGIDQFIQKVSQQLPFPVVVGISPFAMTQDAVLQFSSRSDRPHLVFHRVPSRIRDQSRVIDLQTLSDHTIQ